MSRVGHEGGANVIDVDANAADDRRSPRSPGAKRFRWRHWCDRLVKLAPTAPTWRIRLNDVFAGITWGALTFVLVVCALDAFRDSLVAIVEAPAWRWFRYFWRRLYPTALMAMVMMLAVAAALNRCREPGWRQALAIAAAVLVPCALGVLLKIHLLGALYMKPRVMENWYYESAGAYFAWYFIRYAALGLLVATAYAMHRRERQRIEALLQTEIAQARMREQMDEARLQTLLAQIEPHFLFNTLANVRGLYQTRTRPGGEAMLGQPAAVPRASHCRACARQSRRSAARPCWRRLILNVQKIRMGGRLVVLDRRSGRPCRTLRCHR